MVQRIGAGLACQLVGLCNLWLALVSPEIKASRILMSPEIKASRTLVTPDIKAHENGDTGL